MLKHARKCVRNLMAIQKKEKNGETLGNGQKVLEAL
jgi:hypothetical protein